MLIVSSMLKHVAYPCLAELKYFHKWRARQANCITVLTYHGVFPQGYKRRSQWLDGNLISADQLHRQLTLLKSRYDVISPDDFQQSLDGAFKLPERPVLITCDDGLLNIISGMLPILKSLDLKCLFFLTANSYTQRPGMLWYEELWLLLEAAQSGNLGFTHPAACLPRIPADPQERHAVWWQLVRELSKTDIAARLNFIQELGVLAKVPHEWKAELLQDPVEQKRFELVNIDQVDELVRAGMTIGAHTQSHPVLSLCAREDVEAEIVQPLKLSVSNRKMCAWALAYPYGTPDTVSSQEYSLAKTAGYCCAFMNLGGNFLRSTNRFAIPRINITGNMTPGEFEAHASGFHQKLQDKLNHQPAANSL